MTFHQKGAVITFFQLYLIHMTIFLLLLLGMIISEKLFGSLVMWTPLVLYTLLFGLFQLAYVVPWWVGLYRRGFKQAQWGLGIGMLSSMLLSFFIAINVHIG
ncbi:hypothetical protein [Magnetococcus sp. PR-3]|uniref:hypothetical protein n=1 Tax=Magnetococcus sp. PR-3 TaxID=3120355 RepID=UPI002FCE5637